MGDSGSIRYLFSSDVLRPIVQTAPRPLPPERSRSAQNLGLPAVPDAGARPDLIERQLNKSGTNEPSVLLAA
jgi:hypothetical protein